MGEKSIRSRVIEEYKQGLSLTDEQREVLFGLLLGDACLETQNGGRTYRMKVEQSLKHQAYLFHLYELFKDWVPRNREVISKESISNNLVFQTVSHSAFRFYAQQFYADGRKRVPKLIHRWLTPRALSYWYMDDGSIKSKQSKGLIFNTQGFNRSEVERLAEALQKVFALQTSVRNQKDGCQIYISGNSYERFVELVSPHIIDEMQYKLPSPRTNTIA